MPWFVERDHWIPAERLARLMEQTVAEARQRICASRSACCCCLRTSPAHSGAGWLTEVLYNLLSDEAEVHVIPTLGQHVPHTPEENRRMFGAIPEDRIHAHDWRGGCVRLGEIPADYVREASRGAADWPIPIHLNRMLMEKPWDLIVNVGHVVPHEVLGFANHNENYFIGLAGKETICASHMAAACCGIENNLGTLVTPVRDCFNKAENEFLGKLPDLYVQVVMARNDEGQLVHTGVYVGDDLETYLEAARQSREQNITVLDEPMPKSRLPDAGGRVLQHLGGQQGDLPHADGPGRRRGVAGDCPRPEAVRRAAGRQRPDPQVRLLRHAEGDGGLSPGPAPAGPRPCRRPPHPRLVGRAIFGDLRPGRAVEAGNRRRRFPICRLDRNPGPLQHRRTDARLERNAGRRADLLHSHPLGRPVGDAGEAVRPGNGVLGRRRRGQSQPPQRHPKMPVAYQTPFAPLHVVAEYGMTAAHGDPMPLAASPTSYALHGRLDQPLPRPTLGGNLLGGQSARQDRVDAMKASFPRVMALQLQLGLVLGVALRLLPSVDRAGPRRCRAARGGSARRRSRSVA